MIPQVTWWHDVAVTPPVAPLLVVALADDADAVSVLPHGHSNDWLHRPTPTSRVAEYLGVQVVAAGEDLPDHDLLLVGAVGRGLTTVAAALATSQFLAEPQLVTGHGSGISDVQWMDKVVDVRSRQIDAIPAPVAALAEVLERAEVPVLLDGVIAAAAAAVVSNPPPMQAPVLGSEPVQRYFLERADIPVWGSSGIGPGEGLGALSGLAMLRLGLLADS